MPNNIRTGHLHPADDTAFWEEIRNDFPVIRDSGVAYLDNSATSQKPSSVMEAVDRYYRESNANPFRGLYSLSTVATEAYENARKETAEYINADPGEIVFTRNATESLNLIAYSYGGSVIRPGDEILVAISEHHSNMLPWRLLADRAGATVKYFYPCDEYGHYSADGLREALSEKTKIFAIAQVSNVLGIGNDVRTFAGICHSNGTAIVVDGAQSIPHMKTDVRDMDADFFVFSGHKMLAPMGIGVLYGKRKHLESMPPFLSGGEMIETVTTDKIVYAEVPHRFEAGTVNVGGAAGLAEAMRYYRSVGIDSVIEREKYLTRLLYGKMKDIPHVHILGSDDPDDHHGILTFDIDGVHPHDIAAIFDSENIAVRAGHHCAMPLHRYLNVLSSTRASIMFYNNEQDIDLFAECLSGIRRRMML